MKWTNRLKMTMLVIQENSDTDKDVMDGVVSAAESLAEKLDALTAERERLAAEISATNAAYATLLESHELILDALTESDDTLDRLREVGIDPSYHGNPADWANEDKLDSLIQFQAILYPPETTSIRDTAAAHGFDAMPDDLAQRSVDGETNYVRLNPENET